MADEKEKKETTTKKAAETKKTTKTAASKTNAAKVAAAKKETVKKEEVKTAAKKVEETKNTVKVEKSENKSETEELVAKATVKYARISSRKIAIVANLIRGKNVDEALAILKFTPKAGSEVLEKLLKSAIANAENNNQMSHSKLYIAEIYSNQGPTLKRIRPAAKGSAVRIRKRTSNTTIVLKERV